MKNVFRIICLGFVFAGIVACSGGNDEVPTINVISDDMPRPKIRFYEDTVYINKSGGSSLAFLSYPSHEEVDIVNNYSWLSYSPFSNYLDGFPTSSTTISANTNNTGSERTGYMYFRYKDEAYRSRTDLMDTLVIVQLKADSVLTATSRTYKFDEHAHQLAVFVPYSEYYTAIDDQWITETTNKRSNTPRAKFTFDIEELTAELDIRSSDITFYQPKDQKSVTRTATIEQRRAIVITNRINVMKIDTEHTLSLNLTDAVKNQALTFKSSDEQVATISNEGTIRALSKGSTIISIESADGEHITTMPLVVKTILNKDDNNVSIGMGIEILTSIRFFISITNASGKDIHLDKLTIKNNDEVVWVEEAEEKLGTLTTGMNKLYYFILGASHYNMDCELLYTLDGAQYAIGEESGIIIQ